MTTDTALKYREATAGAEASGRSAALHVSDRLFMPGRVEVSAIGDIASQARTILSRDPLEKVLYLYLLDGAARVQLSDAGGHALTGGDVMVVFPGRIATVELTGPANRLMLVALSGLEAVDASLRMGYWDLVRAHEAYEGNFMTEIIERFHSAPARGRDEHLLAQVEHLLATVWLRARHGSGRGVLFNAVRTLNREICTGDRPTTERVSEMLQVSRSKLNALFLEGLGMRPGEYISRTVVARAKAKLFWTTASVAKVAGQFGFSSASAFAAFFRRRTGQTPDEFRRRSMAAQ